MNEARVRSLVFGILIASLGMLAGCSWWPGIEGTKRIWRPEDALETQDLPSFQDDLPVESLESALKESIAYFEARPIETQFKFGPVKCPTRTVAAFLKDFANIAKNDGLGRKTSEWLSKNSNVFSANSDSVLFTGYYEAQLQGSRKQTALNRYPLYSRPSDLISLNLEQFIPNAAELGLPALLRGRVQDSKFVPYYDRKAIDFGKALEKKKLELAFVNDPIEAFFLHVQGSGVIALDDGTSMRVGYAEANGHPYRAIANWLVKNEKMNPKDISAQFLRRYLEQHPEKHQEILSFNPSYVFFREVQGGPYGSIGKALTAKRSIATDSSLFPKGGLALIKTKVPVLGKGQEVRGWKEVSRFVMNQDTGGAIKGPGRVDLFMGSDKDARAEAGVMRQQGELYFFAPRVGCE